MNDFIKSIFTTPVNLWTLGQELFVMGVVFGAVFIFWVIMILLDKK